MSYLELSGPSTRLEDSYVSNLYLNGTVTGSIVANLYNSGSAGRVEGTDVILNQYNTKNIFFENSFISSQTDFSDVYDGLGLPVDEIGDGFAETSFELNGTTHTVDGIVNPRSSRNFANGIDDIWDANGVGALWDAANPELFPEP
ncbi:MAG: hypothetical protein HQL48_04120 [Gammaproteobacteria bacterium]|nr:hypothetical protein [Gammaproteobacteria bacterium]